MFSVRQPIRTCVLMSTLSQGSCVARESCPGQSTVSGRRDENRPRVHKELRKSGSTNPTICFPCVCIKLVLGPYS